MKQLIDFEGCALDKYIYPTDIDAMIEYKDSKYLLFEVKYEDSVVPVGQRLALQRMVDDFTKTGKQAIVIICTYHISNPNEPIIMANCRVREVYYGEEQKWRSPDKDLTVAEAIDSFQKYSDIQINHSKEVQNERAKNNIIAVR